MSMVASRAYQRSRSPPSRLRPHSRTRSWARSATCSPDGTFHESTVEEVAARAGVARATLYQHFGSRLGLVDAICETFAENPALVALRQAIELEDVEAALEQTIANSVRFWASEEPILRPLTASPGPTPRPPRWSSGRRPTAAASSSGSSAALKEHGRVAPGLTDRTCAGAARSCSRASRRSRSCAGGAGWRSGTS